jgi:hypothetical protein
MAAVWMRLRSEWRARRRAWLALSLLVALFFAPALVAATGARRTSSVYPRFLAAQRAWDVVVIDSSIFADILWKPDYDALESLPYLESSARFRFGEFHGLSFAFPQASGYGRSLNRLKVVEGRLPRVDAPDEVAVPVYQKMGAADPITVENRRRLARAHPGDRVTLAAEEGSITLTVVGRTVAPFDLPPSEWDPLSLVSSGAYAKVGSRSDTFATDAIALRFRSRSDVARFDADVQALTKGKAVLPLRQEKNARGVEYSARVQGLALALLAGIAGITAVLLFAQSLARQTVLESEEHPALRALGMTKRQTFALGVLRAGAIAAVGAALSGLTAFLSSGVFPFGIFRVVDPTPGLRFDAVSMLFGPLAIVALAFITVSIPAWRSVQVEQRVARPSRLAAALGRAGVSTVAVSGVRLALERGRGRTAVPVRSTVAIVTLGILAMVTALGVSSSTDRLLVTPALYGKTWDKVLGMGGEEPGFPDGLLDAVAAQPEVLALAAVDTGAPFTVDGKRVGGLSLLPLKGSVFPPIVEGRAPAARNEIVLGSKTLQAIGKRIDNERPPTVRLGIEGVPGSIEVLVVGRAVVPPVNDYARFGEGVAVGDVPFEDLLPPGEEPPAPSDAVVRFAPGSDPGSVVARVAKRFPGLRVGDEFARRPSDLVDFDRVRGMPLILSGVLGLIAVASLTHAVVTAIRRRRRDLAILKTLGFVRPQVRHAVGWQASTLIVIASVIGIPLGIVAGSKLWNVIAEVIGVVPSARVPTVAVALLAPGAVLLANLVAVFPARAAARTKPAIVLRSE